MQLTATLLVKTYTCDAVLNSSTAFDALPVLLLLCHTGGLTAC
jgi:hypothetical protein